MGRRPVLLLTVLSVLAVAPAARADSLTGSVTLQRTLTRDLAATPEGPVQHYESEERWTVTLPHGSRPRTGKPIDATIEGFVRYRSETLSCDRPECAGDVITGSYSGTGHLPVRLRGGGGVYRIVMDTRGKPQPALGIPGAAQSEAFPYRSELAGYRPEEQFRFVVGNQPQSLAEDRPGTHAEGQVTYDIGFADGARPACQANELNGPPPALRCRKPRISLKVTPRTVRRSSVLRVRGAVAATPGSRCPPQITVRVLRYRATLGSRQLPFDSACGFRGRIRLDRKLLKAAKVPRYARLTVVADLAGTRSNEVTVKLRP